MDAIAYAASELNPGAGYSSSSPRSQGLFPTRRGKTLGTKTGSYQFFRYFLRRGFSAESFGLSYLLCNTANAKSYRTFFNCSEKHECRKETIPAPSGFGDSDKLRADSSAEPDRVFFYGQGGYSSRGESSCLTRCQFTC